MHFEAEVCVSSHFWAVLQHFIYTCLGSLCFFPEKFPVYPVPSKTREGQAGTGSASEEMGLEPLLCSLSVSLVCCSQSWLLPVLVGAQQRSLLC